MAGVPADEVENPTDFFDRKSPPLEDLFGGGKSRSRVGNMSSEGLQETSKSADMLLGGSGRGVDDDDEEEEEGSTLPSLLKRTPVTQPGRGGLLPVARKSVQQQEQERKEEKKTDENAAPTDPARTPPPRRPNRRLLGGLQSPAGRSMVSFADPMDSEFNTPERRRLGGGAGGLEGTTKRLQELQELLQGTVPSNGVGSALLGRSREPPERTWWDTAVPTTSCSLDAPQTLQGISAHPPPPPLPDAQEKAPKRTGSRRKKGPPSSSFVHLTQVASTATAPALDTDAVGAAVAKLGGSLGNQVLLSSEDIFPDLGLAAEAHTQAVPQRGKKAKRKLKNTAAQKKTQNVKTPCGTSTSVPQQQGGPIPSQEKHPVEGARREKKGQPPRSGTMEHGKSVAAVVESVTGIRGHDYRELAQEAGSDWKRIEEETEIIQRNINNLRDRMKEVETESARVQARNEFLEEENSSLRAECQRLQVLCEELESRCSRVEEQKGRVVEGELVGESLPELERVLLQARELAQDLLASGREPWSGKRHSQRRRMEEEEEEEEGDMDNLRGFSREDLHRENRFLRQKMHAMEREFQEDRYALDRGVESVVQENARLRRRVAQLRQRLRQGVPSKWTIKRLYPGPSVEGEERRRRVAVQNYNSRPAWKPTGPSSRREPVTSRHPSRPRTRSPRLRRVFAWPNSHD